MSIVPFSFKLQHNPCIIRPLQTAPVYEGVQVGLHSFIYPPVKRYFIGEKGSYLNISIDGNMHRVVIPPCYCETFLEIRDHINKVLQDTPARGRVKLSLDTSEEKFKIHLLSIDGEEILSTVPDDDITIFGDGAAMEESDDENSDEVPLKVILTKQLGISLGFGRRTHLRFSKTAPYSPIFYRNKLATDVLNVECNLIGREQVNDSLHHRLLTFLLSHETAVTYYCPSNIFYHFIRSDIDCIEEIRIEVKDQDNNLISFNGLCSGVVYIKY